MEETLRFFSEYEIWIYLVLGALALWQVRKFTVGWQELRGAGFGLERENAQARLNQAATLFVVLLTMAIAEFILVSFVVPSVPGAVPLLTPTLNILATPTITLPPTTPGAGVAELTTTAQPTLGGTLESNGCVPSKVMISSPKDGDEISGVVTIVGTVDIPNFGFYKYEVARPGETVWLTIQAGRNIVRDDKLGDWDTRTIPPGDYLLHLIATDNQGQSLPACVIRVHITAPTPNP